MSSRTCCAFANCKNSLAKTPHLSFHRFPKDEDLATEWIIRSGNNDLFELTPTQLYQKRMCSEHFDPSCFIAMQPRRRLYHNALPRIMLYNDNESKNNNHVDMNDISTPSMNLVQCKTSSILQKTKLNADFSIPSRSISTSSIEISPLSPLEVTTPIKKTYSNINLLKKRLTILKRQLNNARKIIKSLRRSCSRNKSRTVDVKSFLKDAEKFLTKKQLLLLKTQLSQNKTKKFKHKLSNQRSATLVYNRPNNFLCDENENNSSSKMNSSEFSRNLEVALLNTSNR